MTGRPIQKGKVYATVRLPVDLHEAAVAQADRSDVSLNWVINRALERYLETRKVNT